MQLAKLLGGAGILVATALVGGTLIGSALAVPGGSDSKTDSTIDSHGPLLGGSGEYCDIFLDTFAGELGVSRDDLLPAGRSAAVAAIDAAVEAGDMDEDRAAMLKERIDAIDQEACGIGLGLGLGRGMSMGQARGFMHADVLDAAATELQLDRADLIEQLADGVSLEDVAAGEGVAYDDVKSAVLAAVQDDLEAAIAEGLAQDRADAELERVQEWLDEGGDGGLGGPGGRGPGHRGGPWH